MKAVGLIGTPLAHSLSPALHAAAFEHHELDWGYRLLDTQGKALIDVLDQIRQSGWVGANVTLPHKVEVMEHLDEVQEEATAIGAVNTVQRRAGELIGSNTDGEGWLRDLGRLGVALEGRPAIILGAGGAARAVAWALGTQGADVAIVARRREQASELARALEGVSKGPLRALPWERDSFAAAPRDALIVNATPVGMWPYSERSPWPQGLELPAAGVVYDLVYRPLETRFVQEAHRRGLTAHGGLGMLVEQAALANELWTGLSAPREAMRAAALASLEVV